MQNFTYTNTIVSVFVAISLLTIMALFYTIEKPADESLKEVAVEVVVDTNDNSNDNLENSEEEEANDSKRIDFIDLTNPGSEVTRLSDEEADKITQMLEESGQPPFGNKAKGQKMEDHMNNLFEQILNEGSRHVTVVDDFEKIHKKLTILFADLTGDTNEEAVVAIPSGGTGGAFRTLVFGFKYDKIILIDIIEGYKMYPTLTDDGKLKIQTPFYEEDDANCCPSSFMLNTYGWDVGTGKFESIDEVKKTVEEMEN